jgi:predicted aldo/keto reductase-like oxidoreductase
MEHRELGRTGLQVSAIGLGTEFLLDEPREVVVAVIREAIARGVNYFDLFWPHPAFRDKMGVAFAGYRERILLSAHLGCVDQGGQYALTREPGPAEAFLEDYFERVRTDHVDVLFVHNCNTQEDYDRLMGPGGLVELAGRIRGEGRARFIGFSGHNVVTSRQAVESGRIDVLMFPVNLTSQAVPGYRDLLDACAAHQIGLVAMKPYAGGRLLRGQRVVAVEDFQMGRTETMGGPTRFETTATVTPAHCLAYVLAQTSVCTTVPGCKNLEELAAALAYWQATEQERDFTAAAADFAEYPAGQCVYCNHCLPCPAEIDIGRTLSLLDDAQGQPTADLRERYEALPHKASDCVQCGDCVERCPFGVDVIARLEQVEEIFE